MAATALAIVGELPPVRSLLAWYRAWRWSLVRSTCETYRVCDADLRQDAKRQLREGDYRAAVLSARILLELTVNELRYGDGRVATSHLPTVAAELAESGVITKRQSSRVSALYGRASRVVHGRPCNRGRAVNLVGDIRRVIHDVLNSAERAAI